MRRAASIAYLMGETCAAGEPRAVASEDRVELAPPGGRAVRAKEGERRSGMRIESVGRVGVGGADDGGRQPEEHLREELLPQMTHGTRRPPAVEQASLDEARQDAIDPALARPLQSPV